MDLGRMGAMSYLKFLAHVLRTSDWAEARAFLDAVSRSTGRSRLALAADCFSSVLRHEVTPAEYFRFRFPDHPEAGWRGEWVGAFFFRLRFVFRVNPRWTWNTFFDKPLFRQRFAGLVHPDALVLGSVDQADELQAWLLGLPTTDLILKPTNQFGGKGITVHSFGRGGDGLVTLDDGVSPRAFLSSIPLPSIIERRLVNHPVVDALSPTALATVRMHTLVRADGSVDLVMPRLRMALAGHVDNFHAGGIGASIDLDSGVISGPAVGATYGNPGPHEVHPVTGARIPGTAIPFWPEVRLLARACARVEPGARVVGWDIAVTPEGPALLEGNYNPGFCLCQCTEGRGFRRLLEGFLDRIEGGGSGTGTAS